MIVFLLIDHSFFVNRHMHTGRKPSYPLKQSFLRTATQRVRLKIVVACMTGQGTRNDPCLAVIQFFSIIIHIKTLTIDHRILI